MGPLVVVALFGLAGVASWLLLKSKEAVPQEAESVPSKSVNYSLSHPAIPQAPKLADGTGDTAAPEFIREMNQQFLNLFGGLGSHDPVIPTGGYNVQVSDAVRANINRLGFAISKAEGFGIPGTLPTRAKNPGDLKLGDVGNGLLSGKTIFTTAQDGWNALFNQLKLIVGGKSGFYTVNDTFEQFARTWTGNDNWASWAATVTATLKVTQSTRLGDFLGV